MDLFLKGQLQIFTKLLNNEDGIKDYLIYSIKHGILYSYSVKTNV